MQNEQQHVMKTLTKIIKDADIAMLVTQQQDGRLVSRPMQLQKVEFDGDIWLLTRTDTDKYEEIHIHNQVNVAIAGKSYASVSGTAEFVDDEARKKEFWNATYAKIFDMDYTDPRLTLIKVHAESAEYWETGSMAKSVYNFVKKVVGNDEKVQPSKEINQSIDLA